MSGKADCPPEMRKRKKKSNHSLAYQIQITLQGEIKRSSSVTGVILYKLRSFSQVRIKDTCSPSAILVSFKNLRGLGKNWSIWHSLPFKDSDVLLCNWPLSRKKPCWEPGRSGNLPRTTIQPISPRACPGRILGTSPLDSTAAFWERKVTSNLMPDEHITGNSIGRVRWGCS